MATVRGSGTTKRNNQQRVRAQASKNAKQVRSFVAGVASAPKKNAVRKASQMTPGEKAGRKNATYLAAERAAGTVGKNYVSPKKKSVGSKPATAKKPRALRPIYKPSGKK